MEKTSRVLKMAVMQGNFLSMNFDENGRILREALRKCVLENVDIVVCPELCVTGNHCEDHLFEVDTVTHSWEILASLLKKMRKSTLMWVVGMPVTQKGELYDCAVVCYEDQILLVKPKMALRDSGNSHQTRWFKSYTSYGVVEDIELPACIQAVRGQTTCHFGDTVLVSKDGIRIYSNIDVEVMSSLSPVNADIFLHPSASYHEVEKYEREQEYLKFLSKEKQAIYMHANPLGCDGGRLLYEGGSSIWMDGLLMTKSFRFTLNEYNIIVVVVSVCLEIAGDNHVENCNSVKGSESQDNEEGRVNMLDQFQPPLSDSVKGCTPLLTVAELEIFRKKNASFTSEEKHFKEIEIDCSLFKPRIEETQLSFPVSDSLSPLPLHEELALASGNWIWDYLRRAGAIGLFIPLSGGADSSSCATLVRLLADRLFEEFNKKNSLVVKELIRISCKKDFLPKSAEDIFKLLLYTSYLGTKNSSKETRERAKNLASELGNTHFDGDIDQAVDGLKKTLFDITGINPKDVQMGGTRSEDLALQNIQARSRLVISYFVAHILTPLSKRNGFFLVVATGNGDECIRGYFTKYDNSSGDLDPIASWSKKYVNAFLEGNMDRFPTLKAVRNAAPSAELKPLEDSKQVQTDEAEMGFTYEELNLLGKLRKVDKCGPVSMYHKLLSIWTHIKPEAIAEKVKKFFFFYSMNRHKMATLPPGLHSSLSNCDDNRFDQRQILYNVEWIHQFKCLDELVASSKKS